MQPALFYDDIYDALRDVVTALGGPKAVGVRLWPDKGVTMAHTALLNCLDRNRPEKISTTQFVTLLKWAREANCHAAMQYLCAECGYAATPIEPEDEHARLQREFIGAVNTLKTLAPKLEAAQAKLKAVS
jgi:hypothetical protein